MGQNRIGAIHTSNQGYKFQITEYFNSKNCTIKFYDSSDTILKNVDYHQILKKAIKNPNHPSVFNVGFIGIGRYSSRYKRRQNKNYKLWKAIIERGYDVKFKEKHPTYKNCLVDKSWHNFQNFAQWFYENYNPETMDGWHLDKDILVKGNKIYSPKTCCFVPQEINKIFIKSKKVRGDLPIGVRVMRNLFQVRISKNGESHCLGLFNTPEEAFQAYKTAKEAHIKEIADKWRGQITEQTYNALINYNVEIDD